MTQDRSPVIPTDTSHTRALVRLEPIEGQVVAQYDQASEPLLPPSARFIPAPFEGYVVNHAALLRATSKGEKRWMFTNRQRGEGYWYLSADDVKRRLNDAYGPGVWSFYTTEAHRHSARRILRDDDGKDVESFVVTVEGWLRAPFILEPGLKGVGQGVFFPSSRRATAANTIATAESEALKSAAKHLGIGLDLKDDPGAAKLEADRKTLENMVKALQKQGHEVGKLVMQEAPEAWNKKDGVLYHMLDAVQIEGLREKLMKMAGA